MQSPLNSLNPQQQQAVIHPAGPAVVLAGAGSGKTTVLTARALWLTQEQSVDPYHILLITFTNKAANEMRQRIERTQQYATPSVGTFHSFCARLLREEGPKISLDRNYSIYDTDDQLSTLKIIYKDKNIDPKKLNIRAVLGQISQAKNELLTPADYRAIARGWFQEQVAELYQHYQRKLQASKAVDFDDLLLFTVQLLQQDKDTRELYQQRFHHVLVDEYQDTNRAQYELTKLLAAPHDNLFVVGDFSQSIYAWRGADYRNMLHLTEYYPNHHEYRLEQNYRSGQTILDAATSVIALNRLHPILDLWTERHDAEPITLIQAKTDLEEARRVVAASIDTATTTPLSEIAILYRTNAQSRVFEEQLIAQGIAYTIVGGVKFYERKEIKDLISYLRLLHNPNDSISLARVAKLGKRRLEVFQKWWHQQSDQLLLQPPKDLLEKVLDITAYQSKFDPNLPEDVSRLENIAELVRVASQFTTLSDLLENIALIQDGYLLDAMSALGNHQAIQLMSLHSAKGLEFDTVFLVGLEEGLLPHSRSLLSPEQLEEERRLCYVGITRAKRKLYLSSAQSRFNYGTWTQSLPSRFLRDIPIHLLDGDTATLTTTNQQEPSRIVVDPQLIDDIISGDLDVSALID